MPESKEIKLKIHDLSRGGPGVGRDESGRIIFVPFSAPGDELLVELTSVEKRYAEAVTKAVLTASPSRVTPRCSVFGECGGCDWQHLAYSEQWKTKLSGIRHSLKRVGIEVEKEIKEFPAEEIWNYRNRVQLRGDKSEIGFYAKGSKRLVAIEECPIARKEINELLPSLREQGKTKPREYKVEVEVRTDGTTKAFWNMGHAAGGFRQVHDGQNAKLQSWVASHLTPGTRLLDLFGGHGNLSLALASRHSEIHCVDYGAPSTNPEGTPTNYSFHRAPVGPWLVSKAKEPYAGPTSAVLDPPRDGLGEAWLPVVQSLNTMNVSELLVIGCEPDAWARDLLRYSRHGYAVQEVAALDLFPQTHHVEALAVMRKI